MALLIAKLSLGNKDVCYVAGEDLHRMLWLKSRNSEVWLERRTGYTRSTAVMSMVGYLLGLGDRHPSNLMLDRYSGKLLHIDFGDCFEVCFDDILGSFWVQRRTLSCLTTHSCVLL